MSINAVIKFLQAARSLAKQGMSKEQILDFARREFAMAFAEQQFGKIDKSFVDDIVNVFKKEGKTKKGDVVPIKKGR